MGYLRLTQVDRYQIEALITSGLGIREISRQLKRHPSTVLRELRKGFGPNNQYSAQRSERITKKHRHRGHPEMRRIQGEIQSYVLAKLSLDWSPEQITGRMRLEERDSISHATIYRYIERDRVAHGQLWRHLRILRKAGRDKKRVTWKPKLYLPDRVNIDQRPKIVEKRLRLGDYERDTVLGKRGKSVLLTAVDRTSRLLKLALVKKNTGDAVHSATVSLLRNEPLHTITNDNGFEFIRHRKTTQKLSAQVYFNNRYRSWERGTNENTNGLLRQYFPKKTDIGYPSRRAVNAIARRINTRPRKTLGFRTPLEIHQSLKLGGVALAV